MSQETSEESTMANPLTQAPVSSEIGPPVRLQSFHIDGLFGGSPIQISFPSPPEGSSEPAILILAGRNATGKTTILRMIDGVIRLDFDEFRKMPFGTAELTFSTGDLLSVLHTEDTDFPLTISFREHSAKLSKVKHFDYTSEQQASIDALRETATPFLRSVNFQLLELDRSYKLRRPNFDDSSEDYADARKRRSHPTNPLAERVSIFLREAQVDYRRFFRAEELDFLPRILIRLREDVSPPTIGEMQARIESIRSKYPSMKRLGLQTEEEELSKLESILRDGDILTPQQSSLIETYLEMQEGAQKAKDLIANRLLNFESIMDDFLYGKTVRVDARAGLIIQTKRGDVLNEHQLSSGEYHFLYMMVTALLSQRTGSIIAIDEPELSLHISWQRKLVNALASCASGASPLFIFATHSLAISSEHSDKVCELSSLE
jgi:energy-coupling factor transporter ATP-binding protein EcfA2